MGRVQRSGAKRGTVWPPVAHTDTVWGMPDRVEPIAPGEAPKVDAGDWLAEAQRARWTSAVTLLAGGGRPTDVAQSLGVSVTSVSRWMRDPAFAALLAEAQAETRAVVARKLQHVTAEAVDVLASLMRGVSGTDEPVPPAVQARCAAELLDRAGIRGADSSGASADAIEAELLTMPAASLQTELAAAVALLEAQARRVETTTETTVTVVAAPDAAR